MNVYKTLSRFKVKKKNEMRGTIEGRTSSVFRLFSQQNFLFFEETLEFLRRFLWLEPAMGSFTAAEPLSETLTGPKVLQEPD